MNYRKIMLSTALLCAAAPLQAAANGVSADVRAGLRQAGFLAAPSEQRQNLAEVTGAAGISVLPSTMPLSVSVGAYVAFQSMQNTLGAALTSFSGYQIGPEAKVSHTYGAFTPYGRLRYAFGRFQGDGQENWGDEAPAAYFLYDSEEKEETKNFVSQGSHVAVGLAYAVSGAISVAGELDLGYERMRTDARIIENDREHTDKAVTAYRSQALLVGGAYAL